MDYITTEPILHFEEGGHVFDVYKVQEGMGIESHLGYCDGVRAIAGTRADVVAKGLRRKYITGLPEGKLIPFRQRTGA